jgi:hypothetical protein
MGVSTHAVIEAIFRDAFEDVALLIGGAASLHQLDNGLIRTLVRRLARVRTQAISRLAQVGGQPAGDASPEHPHRLHAAVEGFLQRNCRGYASAEKEAARDK